MAQAQVTPSRTPEYRRAYREKNRERRAAYNREWWAKNKGKKYPRNLVWRQANRDKIEAYRVKYRDQSPWVSLFGSARKRCKQRGLEFSLTAEWARARWTGRCEISGLQMRFGDGAQHMLSPTIDRKDAAKGYTPDNCRFVCLALNAMRGTGTDEEMIAIMRAAVAKAAS